MKVNYYARELELEHTFTISRSSNDTQRTLIVELSIGDLKGFGEATENPYYGITIEKMINDLIQIRSLIEQDPLLELEEYLELLAMLLPDNYFLRCALDMALHDLFARQAGKPLYEYWGLSPENIPISNFTIGIDTIERMIEKLRNKPWPLYKIKLGTKEDVEIIQALRKETDAVFRVDANCGWTPEETVQKAVALKSLGVEYIEQPLPADDWEGMKYVFENSVLPVIADESCELEGDVDKCIGHFHGINIKLVKCGGFKPALNMIRNARTHNMKVMVGCMTESSVGISAIAQLLPLIDFADLDGALLLKKDIAKGVEIIDGKVILNTKPGIGVELML